MYAQSREFQHVLRVSEHTGVEARLRQAGLTLRAMCQKKGAARAPFVNEEVIFFYCFRRHPVLKIQATAEMHRNKNSEIAAKDTPTGTSETSKNDQRNPEIR